jgi:hypothetical protein
LARRKRIQNKSGSAVAEPLIFLLWGIFFGVWWRGVFSGVFAKKGVLVWCFCGEVVVNCVVNRGAVMVGFWRLKICHCFEFYFLLFFERRLG